MNKDLNFRFFYYRTRAAYEFDKANGDMPDGAIIFIEEANSIITHGHEFGPSTHFTISPEDRDLIVDTITRELTAQWGSLIEAVNHATEIASGIADRVGGAIDEIANLKAKDINLQGQIDTINTRLDGIDTAVGNLDNGASVLLAAQTYTNAKADDLQNLINSINNSLGNIDGSIEEMIGTATDGISDSIQSILNSLSTYETKSDANTKLNNANAYTDSKFSDANTHSNNNLQSAKNYADDILNQAKQYANQVAGEAGNPNALQSEIDALDSRVDTIESQISGVNTSISSLNSRITTVEGQINNLGNTYQRKDTLTNDIINNDTIVSTISNNVIQLCSYTAGTGINISNDRVISVNVSALINSLTENQIAQLKALLGTTGNDPETPIEEVWTSYTVSNNALETENVAVPLNNTLTIPGTDSTVSDRTVNLVNELIS